jgi:hypothetical protein
MNPTTLAYGGASASFALLAALSLLRWRRSLSGRWIIPALAATSAWAALLALLGVGRDLGDVTLFVASVLQTGLWLAVLARIVPRSADPWLRYTRWAAFAAPVAAFAAGAAALVLRDLRVLGPDRALPIVPCGMMLALLGLVLLEQVFRNATAGDRWALKYVLLGIGAIFAIDLVVYANAFAFGSIDALLWESRGGGGI